MNNIVLTFLFENSLPLIILITYVLMLGAILSGTSCLISYPKPGIKFRFHLNAVACPNIVFQFCCIYSVRTNIFEKYIPGMNYRTRLKWSNSTVKQEIYLLLYIKDDVSLD